MSTSPLTLEIRLVQFVPKGVVIGSSSRRHCPTDAARSLISANSHSYDVCPRSSDVWTVPFPRALATGGQARAQQGWCTRRDGWTDHEHSAPPCEDHWLLLLLLHARARATRRQSIGAAAPGSAQAPHHRALTVSRSHVLHTKQSPRLRTLTRSLSPDPARTHQGLVCERGCLPKTCLPTVSVRV